MNLTQLLKHRLTHFILVLALAYLVFRFGTPLLSQLLTGRPAPMPSQVLWAIYMPTILLALFLYVSADEAAWEEFKAPLRGFLVERRSRPIVVARAALLVALPLLAGWLAYSRIQPRVTPPPELRSIHPAPVASIDVDGQTINLRTAANPFRQEAGSPDPQALAAGKILYGQYCVYCHGDALDGQGLFASAMRPPPADFTDPGTIALLQESFLFWRIAEGGPGMPHEGKGWNSAMPAWNGELTADQIWQVILYLYDATGQHPLSVEEGASEPGDPGGTRVAGAAASRPAAMQAQELGQSVYTEYCEVCHGAQGDADTPPAANMDPRPRDLRRGWYKIRTTATGQLPLDSDILRVIQRGMPGTTMPGWEGVLSDAEIQAVAEYVKTFSRRFEREQPAAVAVGAIVPSSPESIARGKELFMGTEAECHKCHGVAGRGDGPSADELTEDSFGDVIVPADLTMPWLFRGGPTVDDIYMRMKTGMTGGPMPSYADVLSDDDLWRIANYVDSLAPDAPPEPEPLLVAARSQAGSIPDDPQAEAWQAAQEQYVPLFGQVMREPRNYTPSISGVWVSVLYDDRELALRLRWNDRFSDSGADGSPADGLAVQFPASLPETDERPYFVFGDASHPVNLWVYDAGVDAPEERTAAGTSSAAPQAGQDLSPSAASYADGEYTLILRRALQTGDAQDIQFETGKYIPVAFAAWDGWQQEQLASGAISTWLMVYLAKPTPVAAFAWVPAAMLAMALFEAGGLWAVRRSAGRAPDVESKQSIRVENGEENA
jgi:DMSO reductase family type II enzyme heme b subunit